MSVSHWCAAGVKKANMPVNKIFLLSILSGVHIAFGAFLMVSVGGACPGLAATNPGLQKMIFGAFGLPFGLMMTLVTGAELFTGNTALVTAAVLEGKASLPQLLKSWIVSFSGNFVGSLFMAAMVRLLRRAQFATDLACVKGLQRSARVEAARLSVSTCSICSASELFLFSSGGEDGACG
eukprot:6201010-Pleurochrysis_carterae.AAC.7